MVQGRNENILTFTDKIHALQKKIGLWKKHVAKKNLEMFPLVAKTNHSKVEPLILSHLEALQKKLDHYFPSLSIKHYDWIRNQFISVSSDDSPLSLDEEEELTEIVSDRTWKLSFAEKI